MLFRSRVIRDAIQREINREGQVFYLHNRVFDIDAVASRLQALVPHARIVVGHGQMNSDDLEKVMTQFVNGEADVLLSTTIIESGLDIPNANTIIIDRADRFGLSNLYQLRGRVGRYKHQAYAYLLLPRHAGLLSDARKRMSAIKQYSSLGSGFKIAMRDLEIRGAGNILGTAQSGHIVTIGFDLYCALLRQAIAKLKGERGSKRIEVALRLDFVAQREVEWMGANAECRMTNDEINAARAGDASNSKFKIQNSKFTQAPAFLPVNYISETGPRIAAYRQLNSLATQEALDKLRKEWRDRYGRFPEAVENLLTLAELRISSAARKISGVEVKDCKLMLMRGGDYILIGGKFPRLAAKGGTEQLREALKMIRSL